MSDPDSLQLVERLQGDIIVQRVVTMGTKEEITLEWNQRYPSDTIRLFPCEIDSRFYIQPIE